MRKSLSSILIVLILFMAALSAAFPSRAATLIKGSFAVTATVVRSCTLGGAVSCSQGTTYTTQTTTRQVQGQLVQVQEITF